MFDRAANQDGQATDRRARLGFGGANLAVAAFVLAGVFRLLPSRWWLIDTGAIVIALLLGASGVALVAGARIAEPLTRVATAVVLVLGLSLVAALVATAAWLGGVYGQVGLTGALVFGLVAALVVPYVVVLPLMELVWLGPRARRRSSTSDATKGEG